MTVTGPRSPNGCSLKLTFGLLKQLR